LAGKVARLFGPSLNLQVMGVYQPITGLYYLAAFIFLSYWFQLGPVALLKDRQCDMGRVNNHCSLHRRLAKFRGLMHQVKYSPVIGWESCTFVWSQSKSPGYGNLPANHRAVFHLVHQTAEFCQTTVWTTVGWPLPV